MCGRIARRTACIEHSTSCFQSHIHDSFFVLPVGSANELYAFSSAANSRNSRSAKKTGLGQRRFMLPARGRQHSCDICYKSVIGHCARPGYVWFADIGSSPQRCQSGERQGRRASLAALLFVEPRPAYIRHRHSHPPSARDKAGNRTRLKAAHLAFTITSGVLFFFSSVVSRLLEHRIHLRQHSAPNPSLVSLALAPL